MEKGGQSARLRRGRRESGGGVTRASPCGAFAVCDRDLRRAMSAGQGAGTAPTDTRVEVAHNSGGYGPLGRGGFHMGGREAGAWGV